MAEGFKHDVFISYATDDGSAIALPLGEELEAAGLRVWLDGHSMTAGDDLEASIVDGMTTSQWTALVLTPGYLRRGRTWTEREAELVRRLTEARGRKVMIPVWYGVDEPAVRSVNAWLADRLGFRPSFRGFRVDVGGIARHILSVVDPHGAAARADGAAARDHRWREDLAAIAARLPSELPVTVRVRALADLGELADRSTTLQRQECVDLLCRVVRAAGDTAQDDQIRAAAIEQVVERMVGAGDRAVRWSDMHLDFSGARFSSLNMANIEVHGGLVDFQDATFDGEHFNFWKLRVDAPLAWQGVRFGGAVLRRGVLYFDRAEWRSGSVDLSGMTFDNGEVQFRGGHFGDGVGARNGKPFPPVQPPDDMVMRIGPAKAAGEPASGETVWDFDDGTGLQVRLFRDQYSGQL